MVILFAVVVGAAILGGCAPTSVSTLPARAPRAVEPAVLDDPSPPPPAAPAPFAALFRGLPVGSAALASDALAARLEGIDERCPFAHVARGNGQASATFGTCPGARGSLRASFTADGDHLRVELELHDFWQRDSDLLSGAWHLDVGPDGEPRFVGETPWRDVPSKPAATQNRGAVARKGSSGLGGLRGKGGALLLPFVLVGALAGAAK